MTSLEPSSLNTQSCPLQLTAQPSLPPPGRGQARLVLLPMGWAQVVKGDRLTSSNREGLLGKPEVTEPESRAKMRQGHRAHAIAEHTGLAQSLYEPADQQGQRPAAQGGRSRGWEAFWEVECGWSNGAWIYRNQGGPVGTVNSVGTLLPATGESCVCVLAKEPWDPTGCGVPLKARTPTWPLDRGSQGTEPTRHSEAPSSTAEAWLLIRLWFSRPQGKDKPQVL